MKNIPELFSSMVFNDDVMKEMLCEETYAAIQKAIQTSKSLDIKIANEVAKAMKEWAVGLGATHYTHWFQPMTGITAEKHDSFVSSDGKGHVIMEFSGKELVKGEPDASSFPNGGLRATFEARGYTAWDPTSYAFVKDNTLYIPTAFCSFGGQALDKKTPLLRSMDALNVQALRILKLFGHNDVKRVIPTVGAEQEYFLVDRSIFNSRPDLLYCGRTLLGARPTKGQELDDHYFGSIKPRVAAFMAELDEELWKLGVIAKTEHNEAAPAQHELAPIYNTTNVATDHNQLTMELMKNLAAKHGMACLLHEKPFAAVNGSGKHNNWSLSTDTGINLLDPGDTPSENAQFLLFLVAVLKAVDEYQDFMRASVASAGNDHRLGAHEAPPAIISVFLGEELTEIMAAIESKSAYKDRTREEMEIGANVLPHFPRDTTDRNRTSPFAFTGNKFEFRMLGSSLSVAGPNIVLNTIIAESLCEFADILEKSENFSEDLKRLIRRTIKDHSRIVFNGDGYSEEWIEMARLRGLSNLQSTVDALPAYVSDKVINVCEKHGVFTETELRCRYDIMLESYCKTINIEALTMADMVRREILPAVLRFQGDIANVANAKMAACKKCSTTPEAELLSRCSELCDKMYAQLYALESVHEAVRLDKESDNLERAVLYRTKVLLAMEQLRKTVDALELTIPASYWPYPSYGEILYSVK